MPDKTGLTHILFGIIGDLSDSLYKPGLFSSCPMGWFTWQLIVSCHPGPTSDTKKIGIITPCSGLVAHPCNLVQKIWAVEFVYVFVGQKWISLSHLVTRTSVANLQSFKWCAKHGILDDFEISQLDLPWYFYVWSFVWMAGQSAADVCWWWLLCISIVFLWALTNLVLNII